MCFPVKPHVSSDRLVSRHISPTIKHYVLSAKTYLKTKISETLKTIIRKFVVSVVPIYAIRKALVCSTTPRNQWHWLTLAPHIRDIHRKKTYWELTRKPFDKSHNTLDVDPTMHHFVKEMYPHGPIFVTKLCIVDMELVHCGQFLHLGNTSALFAHTYGYINWSDNDKPNVTPLSKYCLMYNTWRFGLNSNSNSKYFYWT